MAAFSSRRARRQSPPSRKRFPLPVAVRDGTWLFAVVMTLFGAGGALFGALYPQTQMTVTSTMSLEPVYGTEGAGFQGYVIYLSATTLLGIGVCLWSFRHLRREPLMLCWLAVLVFLGAWWFGLVGDYVVHRVFQQDTNDLSPGDVVNFTDYVSVWPAVMVAPSWSAVVYWVAAVSSDPRYFDNSQQVDATR